MLSSFISNLDWQAIVRLPAGASCSPVVSEPKTSQEDTSSSSATPVNQQVVLDPAAQWHWPWARPPLYDSQVTIEERSCA